MLVVEEKEKVVGNSGVGVHALAVRGKRVAGDAVLPGKVCARMCGGSCYVDIVRPSQQSRSFVMKPGKNANPYVVSCCGHKCRLV